MKFLVLILFISFGLFAQTKRAKESANIYDIDLEKLGKSREQAVTQPQLLEPAFDKKIDSTKYVLGAGDQILIKVWGVLDEQFITEVTPEGFLIIPSVAEISVAGEMLADASKLVKSNLARSFKNASFSVRLIRMRKFRVFIVGEIENPGTYYLRGADRVVDALQLAGGVHTWGDETCIQVRHLDEEVDTLNISRFYQEGDLEENVFVSGGDIIYVPRIDLGKPYVIIDGNVGSQGVYQTLPNETLLEFLVRVGALSRNSNIENVVLIRDDKKFLYDLLENETLARQEILQTQDRIIIPTNRDRVYVKGEVAQPGPFPYLANYTARDYAGFAGILETAKSFKDIYVVRKESNKVEKGGDVIVQRGDAVVVPRNARESLKEILAIITPIISIGLSSYALIRTTR